MKEKLSIWTFFIRRRAVSILLTIAIILLGISAFTTMPRDIQPEVNIPIATITTILPGATPKDTESLITIPIEKEIAGTSNIQNLTSISGMGISNIMIEFDTGTDLTQAVQDLKDHVDNIKNILPIEANDPMVSQVKSNTTSIISFSIIGKRSIPELTEIAKEIRDELEKIEGVSKVEMIGGQEKIIEINIDKTKAESYGLNIQNVADLIKYSSPNVPIGIISTDNINYSLRVDNKFQTIEELQNLPLMVVPDENNTTILLSDIATVRENYPQSGVKSKLSVQGKESKQTVTLQLFKKDQSNVLKIADLAKEKITELEKNIIPADVEIAVSNDNSTFIRSDLGILTSNGIQTTIFITIILFLALGFAEGFIAGLSIPLSLLFAVTVMNIMGLTINSLTLFALVIALGLMVDTAIVIMEGIHLNMKNGMNSTEAAINSVETYKWPLIAGTLTTIFAFFPMLLVQGLVGEFLKALPLTISAALLGSLFISLTIGPSITARLLQKHHIKEKTSILESFFDRLGDIFHNIIYFVIGKTSGKIITVIVTLALFLGSMYLPLAGLLKVEMFPQTDIQFFIINIETPKGSDLAKTEALAAKVENIIYEIPEVDNFLTILGSSQSLSPTDIVAVGGASEPNLANITVNLVTKDQRERKSYQISEEVRNKLAKINDGKVTLKEMHEGPPTEAPITVRIKGENLETLKIIANDIVKIIQDIPGTQNTESSFKTGINEIKFTLDRNKIIQHGLNPAQVAIFVRNALQGIEATTVNFDNKDFDLIVQYNLPKKNGSTDTSIDLIKSLEIATPKGYSVPLGELGSNELVESAATIQRENQKKVIRVISDLEKDISPTEIVQKIQTELGTYKMPDGYEISFGGDTEAINESFQDLFRSMTVAVILIAFTLVIMFNSLKQPFIILLTLPLAIIGVFPGLMFIGLKFSFPAFLGIVALSGVVVNDAIILIDKINQNRREKVEFKEAIAEAAKSRLQPIIITSLTTIVGILPLALSNEFWAGLGFTLIFGLSVSTLLTLIVVPVFYYLFEKRAILPA